jgi:hypothetical protein
MRHSKIIAIDLDGTLAHYDGWKGPGIIGDPIPEMVEKVKLFMANGFAFWVFTARIAPDSTIEIKGDAFQEHVAILEWLRKHEIPITDVTCIKHKFFCEFWDDRAKHVVPNTGLFQHEWDDRNSIPQLGI